MAEHETTTWEIWRAPLLVWSGLLALLALTLALAYIPLGAYNLISGLVIAAAKAFLVALFFMQLRNARPLHQLAAAAGTIWVFILFLLIYADYMTRGAPWR